MRSLGKVSANLETATRAGEFVALARILCASSGYVGDTVAMAKAQRISPRVVSVLETGIYKSAVAAGGLAPGNWGAELGDYGNMITAFVDSLKTFGAFDSMLPSMKRVPLRTRLAFVSIGATGAIVPGGHVSPITQLSLTGNMQIDEHKALAILVMSVELARMAGSAGNDLFARELRAAISVVTDQQFIALITAGVTPIASSGSSVVAVRTDLAAALAGIETDAQSDIFVLVPAKIAKAWALTNTESGAPAFPEMGVLGGMIAGMRVIVTSGAADGTIVVADANQIAANAGGIELAKSTQADIQFDTVPDSPTSAASVLQSLWQSNNVALRALRYFGAHKIGADAVAVIEGVSYSGDSPS